MPAGYSIQSCRHLLLAVRTLHEMGHELLRVVPQLLDSPGGGRWCCGLVPAGQISVTHGARLDANHSVLRLERQGYPTYPMGKVLSIIDPTSPLDRIATRILELYPDLSMESQGRDAAYGNWYREMLQATEPEGLIIAAHWGDSIQPPPTEFLRVVGGRSKVDQVPPPPPRPK